MKEMSVHGRKRLIRPREKCERKTRQKKSKHATKKISKIKSKSEKKKSWEDSAELPSMPIPKALALEEKAALGNSPG